MHSPFTRFATSHTMDINNPDWEYVVEKSILGRIRLSVLNLQPHKLQRALDETLLNRLVQDLQAGFNRSQSLIHVVPKDPLSEASINQLASQQVVESLPEDVSFYVIDGQHQVEALKQIYQSKIIPDNPSFYQWDVVVHSWGMQNYDLLQWCH
jgi:hypothetical protein